MSLEKSPLLNSPHCNRQLYINILKGVPGVVLLSERFDDGRLLTRVTFSRS